jgi:hypothetical protein
VYNAAPCGEQACTFVDLKATDHEESGVGGRVEKKVVWMRRSARQSNSTKCPENFVLEKNR